jgi:hypothetical protein
MWANGSRKECDKKKITCVKKRCASLRLSLDAGRGKKCDDESHLT